MTTGNRVVTYACPLRSSAPKFADINNIPTLGKVSVMAELNPQPLPPRSTIRVTAPAGVLFDLEKFQRAQASVLGRAGCPACTSGLDLQWQALVDFEVDHAGNVREIAAGGSRQ
jgi:hypothetical protein